MNSPLYLDPTPMSTPGYSLVLHSASRAELSMISLIYPNQKNREGSEARSAIAPFFRPTSRNSKLAGGL